MGSCDVAFVLGRALTFCDLLTVAGGGPGGSGGGTLPIATVADMSLGWLPVTSCDRWECEGAPCRCPGLPINAASATGGERVFKEAWRYLHKLPWIQKPSLNLKKTKVNHAKLWRERQNKYVQRNAYMLQSLTSSRECLNGQSGSLHSLYLAKNRQVGIRCLSNWWRKPQLFPLMQSPRSQCRQTVCVQRK